MKKPKPFDRAKVTINGDAGTPNNVQDVLLRQEAADFFRFGLRKLDYLVATGQIPHFRVGKRGVRFRKSTLEKWMAELENQTSG